MRASSATTMLLRRDRSAACMPVASSQPSTQAGHIRLYPVGMGGWLTDVRSSAIALARRIVGGPGIEWTLDRALARLAQRVRVETIVDVGASTGIWTIHAQRHLEVSRALLI